MDEKHARHVLEHIEQQREIARISSELNAALAAPPDPIPPRAGFYPRGSVDYTLIDAVNFSSAKHIETSPFHYDYWREHTRDDTKFMQLGTYNHVAVLEPERFMSDFVRWESTWQEHHDGVTPKQLGTGRARRGKAWEAFKREHSGKEIIRDVDFETAISFRNAVRNSRAVMPLLAVGEPEVAMVWQDPETGLWLKGRVDWRGSILGGGAQFDGRPCITDLKGSSDVTPDVLSRRLAKFRVHAQQAMYSDGYYALTGERPVSAIAAVELKRPHDSVPYQLEPAELEAGRAVYRGWLRTIAECMETGQWPGLGAGGIRPLPLPSYAYDIEDEPELTSGGERLAI